MDESAPDSGMRGPGDMRDPPITSARRRELLKMAMSIADKLEKETTSRERCLLRRMVELRVALEMFWTDFQAAKARIEKLEVAA